MIDPHDPLVQLKITSSTCSFFAILFTGYRLYHRFGRYWADDAWAFAALMALFIQIVSVFLHLPVPNSLPQTSRIAAYYLMAYTFYVVIWCSRLSILFSIVRIDPSERRRKRLFWVAIAFVVALLFLMAQLLWVCEPQTAWKLAPNPQCPLGRVVAICQLVTDILADSILLYAPLVLLRHLADKVLRRKLGIIFSTCIVTTIVSLVHAAYIIRNGGIKVVISAMVENNVSLMVANIPVVVTATIAIGGETDHVKTYQTTSMKFNSLPWFGGSHSTSRGVTTRYTGGITTTVAMQTISEDTDDTRTQTKTPDFESDGGGLVSKHAASLDMRSAAGRPISVLKTNDQTKSAV